MAAGLASALVPDRANWTWREADGPERDHAGRPAVIFDIDGVLSDAAGRQHYIERGRRDWNAFFEACGDDPVIEEIARLLELLDQSLMVVLLTGRPQRVAPQTLAWLRRYGLRWDLLLMRSRGDYAWVTDFKEAAVADLRGPRIRPPAGVRGRSLEPRHVRRGGSALRLHPFGLLRVAAQSASTPPL